MKKTLLLMALLFVVTLGAKAQMISAEDLEKYCIKFLKLPEKPKDKDWITAAQRLKDSEEVALDKNDGLAWSEIIPAEGVDKEKLYIILNYWYTMTFNDAKSVIKLNDKASGTIIGSGFVADIARHSGGANKYQVNMQPVIKADIKDGKVRITYTIQAFPVYKVKGGGFLSVAAAAFAGTAPSTETVAENWMIDKCYPFIPAKEDKHKKSSAKAICMTVAFSNYIMNMIKEAVQHGLSGNENDNW